MQLLLFFSGFQTEKLATGQYLQWLGLAIMAVVLWLGIKAVRDEKPDRALTYGQRVGTGVTHLALLRLDGRGLHVHPLHVHQHRLRRLHDRPDPGEVGAKGLTQAQMEGAEAITRKMLQPGVQAILGVFFVVLIGVILSLIIAALVKPKPQPAAS